MGERLYMGVDVGTGSVRAALFDRTGDRQGMGVHPIRTWRPEEDHVEQSSKDIWNAVCEATRTALARADASPKDVAGIGFDATCSLVVLDDRDRPVTVSRTGKRAQNVVVWMDHRALEQAERINATGHQVLDYVGGVISPEMQTPKLLWLQENLPDTWKRAARFMDLPDFLVYAATGNDVRSLCSVVCKWTYRGDEDRWDESYFREVGLGDLVDEGFRRIGTRVRPMGERAGELSARAASNLGLAPGTPVAVSIIDAHAGGIGMIGAPVRGQRPDAAAMGERLALIGGTSSCHMAVSQEPRFVSGVWGPYYSAMVPGLWLTEGGQSATGALIDHVIDAHSRGPQLHEEAKHRGTTVYALLNERLEALAEEASAEHPAELTRELHVLPYFHGNRSPRADPSLRGMISGLRLTDSKDSLALLYLATIQAVAHGTRHIVESLNAEGYRIDTIFATGGGTKNPVFLREHADATGCTFVLPREPESVLLGAAILGAVASGDQPDLLTAMGEMSAAAEVLEPSSAAARAYHDGKQRVFQRMYAHQLEYRELMGASAPKAQ